MELFQLHPKLHMFDTFREFAESFGLRDTDLLITESLLYNLFVKSLSLPCHIILKDEYDRAEPNDETIDRIYQDLRGKEIRRIVAMGGGSVIDIAKMLMVSNGYPIRKLLSGETPALPDRELIVLPSTCGTGSEVTSGGIVTVKATGLKTAMIDERLTATHSVLIPELIAGLPMRIFMFCSVDALGHAMESHVSVTRGNEFARAMGARAISLILNGYAELILNGPECRPRLLKDFITASCMSGMAVNNGGAGPVHALAYPLGEKYKMSHGESIYQFLTPVFRLYGERAQTPQLREIIHLIKSPLQRAGFYTTDASIFADLRAMLSAVHPLPRLDACGMTQDDIAPFADSIIESKQRLLSTSPLPFTKELIMETYEKRLQDKV